MRQGKFLEQITNANLYVSVSYMSEPGKHSHTGATVLTLWLTCSEFCPVNFLQILCKYWSSEQHALHVMLVAGQQACVVHALLM